MRDLHEGRDQNLQCSLHKSKISMWLILVFLGGKYLLFSLFILVAPFALHFEVPFIGGSQFYWKKNRLQETAQWVKCLLGKQA